ncbi:MAG: hypothetical protein WC217_02415, partial [Candidatus Paceibacterota bacterium]
FELLLVDEERIANSNKVFNAFVFATESLLGSLALHASNEAKEITDDYLHNIIKIHGNQKSIIERCVLTAEGQPSYSDFVTRVKTELVRHPDNFAEDICALSKEIRLVDYHIGGYRLLKDSSPRINITDNHNLKKFLLGLSHLFFDAFTHRRVFFSLHDVNGDLLCSFEYETFNIAMHSFLENAVKYCKPDTHARAYTNEFGQLIFDMVSIRIEADEMQEIRKRGIYGKNVPENLRGSGIGMYQIDRAIRRSAITLDIKSDSSQSFIDADGVKYCLNKFIFSFPKYSY